MSGIHLRKYGVAATVDFDLFEVDGVDFRVDAVHAAGDTVVMKDEGAEASTTNGFTDEGTGYSIVVTATEMQAARIVVYVADLTATKVWLDKKIIIETYGNASAQHAFDLDTASVAQTGDSFARIGAAGVGLTAVSLSTAGILAIWDQATAALTTAGRIGKLLVDNINATVSSRMPTTHIDATAGKVDEVALVNLIDTDGIDALSLDVTASQEIADTLLTRQMSESYAGDDVDPTLAQALFLIQQTIGDFSIAGTTITVKKKDGATTAATYTLDDGTSPTSRTRAT